MSTSVPILAAVVLGLFCPPGDSAHEAGSKRDQNLAQVQFERPPGEVPLEIAEEVKRIETEHRATLNGPVETWRLEPVRHRYEFLLKRASSAAAKDAIERRLAVVARHEEMVRSARTFEMILESSRRRDKQVATTRRTLAELEKPKSRPYAAVGMIQPSSRQVDGHRVFALIGTQGRAIAYLDLPPGLDATPVMSKRVGVRGSVHFDDNLGAKLIAVRDLEPLE